MKQQINLNIPENMKRYNKILRAHKVMGIARETIFEIMKGRRCEKCLGIIIEGSQRKGIGNCHCKI